MARRGGARRLRGGGAASARSRSAPAPSPAAPERRQVRINGAPASANSLSEWLSVLWLTPAMDRLFADGAGGPPPLPRPAGARARPGHAVHAARYEAAMRARNKLLAEERPRDEAWLAALEARMAEHGAAIAAARAAAVAALAERLAAAPEGPFARAGLALEGGDEDLAAALAARPGARRRRRPHPRRPAPHRPRRHPSRQGPARRALLDRRAEGAAASASSSPMPISSPSAPAAARSCSSTRSPPISIRCAAPPCSSGWRRPAARSG